MACPTKNGNKSTKNESIANKRVGQKRIDDYTAILAAIGSWCLYSLR